MRSDVWKRAIRDAIAFATTPGDGSPAARRQEPLAVRERPFALLVELADHPRPDVLAPVVELLLQLVLEELALLLDDEDLLQSLREAPHALGLERPGHPNLEESDADVCREPVVDAEILERLAHVHVRLARGDDAEPRLRAVDDDAVQVVRA